MPRYDERDVFHLHPTIEEEEKIYYPTPTSIDTRDMIIMDLRRDMRRLQRVISDAHGHMVNGNPFKAFQLLDSMMDLLKDTCA